MNDLCGAKCLNYRKFCRHMVRHQGEGSYLVGFHSRGNFCASEICTGVITRATRSRIVAALSLPRMAAKLSHIYALTRSCGTPKPLSYKTPRLYWTRWRRLVRLGSRDEFLDYAPSWLIPPARPSFNQPSGTPSSITGAEGVRRWRGLSPCTCFSRSSSGSTSPSVQRSVRVLTAPS